MAPHHQLPPYMLPTGAPPPSHLPHPAGLAHPAGPPPGSGYHPGGPPPGAEGSHPAYPSFAAL
eukprot:3507932-Rhodomonas_salina.2